MDFFTVPTSMLRVLYGFFVIEHGRRQILHFNATFNPTAAWVTQQIREAFSFDTSPKYLIFDRDLIFSVDVVRFVKAIGTKPSFFILALNHLPLVTRPLSLAHNHTYLLEVLPKRMMGSEHKFS